MRSNGPLHQVSEHDNFPPGVPDVSLRRKIISGFCAATHPSKFEEAGCSVCGALTLQTEILDLSLLNINLSVLNTAGLVLPEKKERIWQSQYLNLMGL
jgi:hypothetical protein